MSKGVIQIPVFSALLTAYFVTETGGIPDRKEATSFAWEKIYLCQRDCLYRSNPQAYLDDADYDVWVEIKSAIEEGFGQVVDQAILFGTNIPFIAYL